MPDDPVDILQRWELAGGVWRIIGRRAHELTIGLFQCDGGERVDVIRSGDEEPVLPKILELHGIFCRLR